MGRIFQAKRILSAKPSLQKSTWPVEQVKRRECVCSKVASGDMRPNMYVRN